MNPLSQVVTWVPVEERLPDDNRDVLVARNCPELMCAEVGWFAHRMNRWRIYEKYGEIVADEGEITHWAEPLKHPSGL